jgi:hypothetical protein
MPTTAAAGRRRGAWLEALPDTEPRLEFLRPFRSRTQPVPPRHLIRRPPHQQHQVAFVAARQLPLVRESVPPAMGMHMLPPVNNETTLTAHLPSQGAARGESASRVKGSLCGVLATRHPRPNGVHRLSCGNTTRQGGEPAESRSQRKTRTKPMTCDNTASTPHWTVRVKWSKAPADR